jgi:DNA-binding GntR family transcriptional regulator
MTLMFEAVQHEKLGEVIYARLSAALVSGTLKPGERLKIRELANQMETSVTPVRDAILHLVQDGALCLRSPRDIRVRELSLTEYLEIRDIRVELEGLAAARASQNAKLADIRALVSLTEENELALRAGDAQLATKLNQMFHFQIATIAQLPILASILGRVWLQMGPLVSESYEVGGRAMIDYHYPIVEAVRRGDADAARQAMGDDIKLGGQVILQRKSDEAAKF